MTGEMFQKVIFTREGQENAGLVLNGYRVSDGGDKKVPELDGSNDHQTM